jgi:hypothetical protein
LGNVEQVLLLIRNWWILKRVANVMLAD